MGSTSARPAGRHFVKGHFQQAGQSEFTHTARMHRSEQHAFQRGEDAYGGLAGDVVLLGDQVDQSRLGEGFLDRAKWRRFGLADFRLAGFWLADFWLGQRNSPWIE